MERKPKITFGYGQKNIAVTEDSVSLNYGAKYLELIRSVNGQITMNMSLASNGYHQMVLAKPRKN